MSAHTNAIFKMTYMATMTSDTQPSVSKFQDTLLQDTIVVACCKMGRGYDQNVVLVYLLHYIKTRAWTHAKKYRLSKLKNSQTLETLVGLMENTLNVV